jgi:hypothetical protein
MVYYMMTRRRRGLVGMPKLDGTLMGPNDQYYSSLRTREETQGIFDSIVKSVIEADLERNRKAVGKASKVKKAKLPEAQEEATPDDTEEEATPDDTEEEATPDDTEEEATPDDTEAQEEEDADEMKLRSDRGSRNSYGNLSSGRKGIILNTFQHGLRVFSDLEFDCEALSVAVKPLGDKKSTKHSKETLQTLILKNKTTIDPMLGTLFTQFRSVLLLMDTYFKVHINLALELLGTEDTFDSLLATICSSEPKEYHLDVFVCEILDPKSTYGKFDRMLRQLNRDVRYATNDEVQNFDWDDGQVALLTDLKRRAQVIAKATTILNAGSQLSPIQYHKAHQDIDKSRYPWAVAVSKCQPELNLAEKVMMACRQDRHKREEEYKKGRAGFTLNKTGRAALKDLIEGVEYEVAEAQEEEEDDTDAGGDTGGGAGGIDDGGMDPTSPSSSVRSHVRECVQEEEEDTGTGGINDRGMDPVSPSSDQTYETADEGEYHYKTESDDDDNDDDADQKQHDKENDKENQDSRPAKKPRRKGANNQLLNNENVRDPAIRKRYKVRYNAQFYYCIYCNHIRQVEENLKQYMPVGTKMDDDLGHYIDQMATDLNIVARRNNSFKKMQRHLKGHFKGKELSVQEMNTKLPPLFESCFKAKGKAKRKRLCLADTGDFAT